MFEQIISIIPTLILSIFNIIIQTMNKTLVEFEKWDFPDQVVKNEIWRSYIQKFISLTLYILLSYEGLYNIKFIDDFLGTKFQERIEQKHLDHLDEGKESCQYDAVGKSLANLAVTEIVVLLAAQLFKATGLYIYKGLIMGQKWRPSRITVISDFSIWMFYNKAVHWLTILPIPYFVAIVPLIDYIGFLMTYILLKNFYSKPTSSSQDISSFLMILMNLTQFYCMVI